MTSKPKAANQLTASWHTILGEHRAEIESGISDEISCNSPDACRCGFQAHMMRKLNGGALLGREIGPCRQTGASWPIAALLQDAAWCFRAVDDCVAAGQAAEAAHFTLLLNDALTELWKADKHHDAYVWEYRLRQSRRQRSVRGLIARLPYARARHETIRTAFAEKVERGLARGLSAASSRGAATRDCATEFGLTARQVRNIVRTLK